MSEELKKQSDTQKHFISFEEAQKLPDAEKPELNAFYSFEAFMEVANQHRPYEPSDFVKESFIPDLVVALLFVTNFAIGTPNGNLPTKTDTKAKTEERVLTELYQNIRNNNQAMVFGNSKVHKL